MRDIEHANAVQIVRSHIDRLVRNDAERQAVLALCADEDAVTLIDLADSIMHPERCFNGVHESPGVTAPYYHQDASEGPVIGTSAAGATIRLRGDRGGTPLEQIEQRLIDPPQQIHEVLLLRRRGFVVIDADTDIFVLTEDEYNAQMGATCSAPLNG